MKQNFLLKGFKSIYLDHSIPLRVKVPLRLVPSKWKAQAWRSSVNCIRWANFGNFSFNNLAQTLEITCRLFVRLFLYRLTIYCEILPHRLTFAIFRLLHGGLPGTLFASNFINTMIWKIPNVDKLNWIERGCVFGFVWSCCCWILSRMKMQKCIQKQE